MHPIREPIVIISTHLLFEKGVRMELSKFLATIHHDTDIKCHASLLGNWFDPNRCESIFNDKYFNIGEFIDTASNLSNIKMDDVYFSLNSFRKRHRTESDVWHLNAFAIDYDFYKLKEYKNLSPDEMYSKHIQSSLKYDPTFVIDSGRGLYVIYVFKHCSRVRKKLYKEIYKRLIKSQEQFGADQKATLVTQVIRLPGTINSRNMKLVEIIESNETNYDILDFTGILPFSISEVNKYKAEEKTKRAEGKRNILKEKPNKEPQKECTYFDDVYKDLKTLIKLRNDKNEVEGYREYMLFLVQYMGRYYKKSPTQALSYALKLNSMLKRPMTDKEVQTQCKPSKICRGVMSIKTIIRKLEITTEEQKHLDTLVTDEMKYELQKQKKVARRRKIKYLNRTEKEYQVYLRRDMVIKLKRKGWTNSKIAAELKTSKQLVACDLKYIKDNAYEFIKKIEDIMKELYAFINIDNFTRYVTQEFNKVLTKWLEISEERLE